MTPIATGSYEDHTFAIELTMIKHMLVPAFASNIMLSGYVSIPAALAQCCA